MSPLYLFSHCWPFIAKYKTWLISCSDWNLLLFFSLLMMSGTRTQKNCRRNRSGSQLSKCFAGGVSTSGLKGKRVGDYSQRKWIKKTSSRRWSAWLNPKYSQIGMSLFSFLAKKSWKNWKSIQSGYYYSAVNYFKSPFCEIGVQLFPKLTRNQNSGSFAKKNGIQSLLPWCVTSNEVLIDIFRLNKTSLALFNFVMLIFVVMIVLTCWHV